jgi:RNA polymerase sigma-70 factor (ECF subfamily)
MLRDGVDSAFEVLFLRYYGSLCTFAHRYVETEAVAEEIVQEVFLYTWRRRGDWKFEGDELRRYLFSAVRNAAMSHLRHRAVERRTAGEVALQLLRSPSPADHAATSDEVVRAVRSAIGRLPNRCREVLTLHRDHGMSYHEIARTLGISPKTVEVHMGRAFKLLREALPAFRP